MSSDAVTPAPAGQPPERSFLVGCVGGLALAAGVMVPMWVLLLKL